jgi:hypothetical protein
MKKFYTLLLFLFATVSILAQAPEKMSYQAVLRDASNTLLTNQEVGMQISILQSTATGTAVYVETQTVTSNINGLVTLEIGTGSVVSGDFKTIDWSTDNYFIKTETDPAGGITYTITGTSQLMSVPFAMYAKTSGDGAGPIGPQGLAGNDGATGASGPQGLAGNDGVTGPQGLAGNGGATGTTGQQGLAGNDGATGADGPAGNDGTTGATGQQGLAGNDGVTGLTGPQGTIGLTGATGQQGLAGNDGATGQQGLAGNDGATGTTGQQGLAGNDGATGADGPAGNDGATGATGQQGLAGNGGATGVTGQQGLAGNDGATGPTGQQGLAGNDGVTGLTGPQGTIGLTGATGQQGIQGATGADGATGIPTGGTEGQVLKIVGGIPTWVDPAVIGQTFYEDSDNDGYGDINSTIVASAAPNGYVSDNTDCNDTDAAINPATVWFIGVDTDGDTFFGSTTSLTQCESPGAGYLITAPATLDCDDSLATGSSINPDAIEVPANGIDDNCDGQVDLATVGELREGGIVFWVDPADNNHGKVCALEDAPIYLNWANAISYSIDYTNSDTGTGVYSNWYLPSIDELQLMYANLQRFGCSTYSPGGVDASLCPTRKGEFNDYYYWSSTEDGNNDAWEQNFVNGNQGNTIKFNINNSVRAVRAF